MIRRDYRKNLDLVCLSSQTGRLGWLPARNSCLEKQSRGAVFLSSATPKTPLILLEWDWKAKNS